jgi:hypothetical protein
MNSYLYRDQASAHAHIGYMSIYAKISIGGFHGVFMQSKKFQFHILLFILFFANHHKLLSHDFTIIIVCDLLFHRFALFKQE